MSSLCEPLLHPLLIRRRLMSPLPREETLLAESRTIHSELLKKNKAVSQRTLLITEDDILR